MSFAEGWSHLEISGDQLLWYDVLRLLSSPVQGLEGILDENDDEDEAENITEVDATRSDHLQIICCLSTLLWGCDWHCWRQEDRKQSQKTEEGQKSSLAKWWPFWQSMLLFLVYCMWYHSGRVDSFHQGTDKDLNTFAQFSLVWSLRVGTIHSRYCELGSQESCCCLRTCFVETQEVLIHVPFLQTTFSLS